MSWLLSYWYVLFYHFFAYSLYQSELLFDTSNAEGIDEPQTTAILLEAYLFQN